MAQRAFLRNLSRGEAYQAEAPTLAFRTAVAQAELEDKPVTAAYHRGLRPWPTAGTDVQIETTRQLRSPGRTSG